MRRLIFALALGLGATGPAFAQTVPANADAIEEDWVLVVGDPDPTAAGPQVTTIMSPVSDTSQPSVMLNFNFRQVPSFQAGGLELAVYDGSGSLVTSTALATDQFNIANETVKWTQRMSLSGGQVHYALPNVTSSTFGTYSGQTADLITYTSSLGTLAGYSPERSVQKSGVPWQRNRVTSMTLVQVRYYSGKKLVLTDTTTRTVNLSY